MTSNVRTDLLIRTVYSVDASIYEVLPAGVVCPKSREEIAALTKLGVPLTPRGAATGTTGGCLGDGIIVDTSRYMNRILSVDPQEKRIVVEPGVTLDEIDKAVRPFGLQFATEISTSNRATIGGTIANNAAGSSSLVYGQTSDHLLEIEMVLADGSIRLFRDLPLAEWEKSPDPLLRKLWNIRTSCVDEIRKYFPKIKRRASGYSVNALVDRFGIVQLIAGSEGTLGIITRAKLSLVPIVPKKPLSLFFFSSLIDAAKAAQTLSTEGPTELEMIDADILAAVSTKPKWLVGTPKAIIAAAGVKGGTPLTPAEEKEFWEIRKAGLGLLMSKRSYSRAIAFIEDLTVPLASLPEFLEEFLALGRTSGIYGHIGEGCLHIRPYIDLRQEKERQEMERLAEESLRLVLKYNGVMSGEHGDGRVRTWLNKKLFHPSLYQTFLAIKEAFDPKNLMNPGKVVGDLPLTAHLRQAPNQKDSFFGFDFTLGVDLCNGNGLCRKSEGTMCPSYQATHDEFDTTRARAQTLRRFDPSDPAVQEVLDLCLACKGCKKECPSQVDMAKMKAESLYQYQKKHGVPLRSRLFGHLSTFNHYASKAPRLFNFLAQFFPSRLFGLAPQRTLPRLAQKRFSHTPFPQPPHLQKEVLLLSDTYTEFYNPEIGFDAIRVLNAMGYRVTVPSYRCCGRPLISKGLLDEAKALFQPFKTDLPVIGLEPSCVLTYRDEFPTKGETFDEFVAKHLLELPLKPFPQKILLHGHCHAKALIGNAPTLQILRSIPEATIEELQTGCCGMAGSFGYEKEHYELSMKIGALQLFPALKQGGTVIASGTSCRTQIHDGTSQVALHLASFLRSLL